MRNHKRLVFLLIASVVLSTAIPPEIHAQSAQPISEFFLDDYKLQKYLQSLNQGKSAVTNSDLEDFRKGACKAYDNYSSYPSSSIRTFCSKYPKIQPRTLTSSASTGSSPATNSNKPRTDSSAHEACLNARDYAGCIKVKTQTNNAAPKSDPCNGSWCTALTPGRDMLGMRKILGWRYSESDDGRSVFYFNTKNIRRIPHKGEGFRYLGTEQVVRYYKNPTAGTSGYYIGGNSATTNCTSGYYSVNCTTTGTTPTYIPGRSATPGGVRVLSATRVVDCKDRTYSLYTENGKAKYKWKPADEHGLSRFLLKSCSEINSLPVMNLKL